MDIITKGKNKMPAYDKTLKPEEVPGRPSDVHPIDRQEVTGTSWRTSGIPLHTRSNPNGAIGIPPVKRETCEDRPLRDVRLRLGSARTARAPARGVVDGKSRTTISLRRSPSLPFQLPWLQRNKPQLPFSHFSPPSAKTSAFVAPASPLRSLPVPSEKHRKPI